MFGARWIIGLAALSVAAIALYLVLSGGGPTASKTSQTLPEISEPVLDDIDAKSRSAMRELLRDAE